MNDNSGYAKLAKKNKAGLWEMSIHVNGVRCAGCIQKIESTLHKKDKIQEARLNFSTGRLYVTWDGKAELAGDIANDVEALGYQIAPDTQAGRDEDKESRFLLLCLGVAGFAMGNIMLLSFGLWITNIETMGFATREFLHWISAIIGIPAVIFAGRPFFRSAFGALRKRQTNMDVPISLALILATSMSLLETIKGSEHVYFDSAVMLMFFLLVGRYLDYKARRSAKSVATELLQTLTGFAVVIKCDKKEKTLIRDLKEDMEVLVSAGEKIPVDGLIIEGQSSIDTSLITGETMPRDTAKGDEVYAGTINLNAPLRIKVLKAKEDSLLSDIVRLIEKAEQGQAKYVRIADKAAKLYTPLVHSLALLTFLLWWGLLGLAWQEALMISITVLIITCPCALGLAVPVVQMLASGRLMKNHILVKSGDALERMAKIDTVIFDKTGTLTYGQPKLTSTHDEKTLQLAASLSSHSKHPLSQAITMAYGDGALLEMGDVEEHAGQGLSASYKGKQVKLGRADFCGVDAADIDSTDQVLFMTYGGNKQVVFHLADTLRLDAAETVQALKEMNMRIVMLSGDRQQTAQKIAEQLGITEVRAALSPVDKFNITEKMQEEGAHCLMVGDGLNDAPVLAAASVSMAPGSAVDMAQNATDMVYMGNETKPIIEAYKVARKTQNLVIENFVLAALYNLVAIPLAVMGYVTPMIAAIAMSGSSLLVIGNSLRVKGKL